MGLEVASVLVLQFTVSGGSMLGLPDLVHWLNRCHYDKAGLGNLKVAHATARWFRPGF